MARKRKRDERPDLRAQGVIVGQEDDGSLFDLGRYGELEALGISAAARANRARDELIRRATIVILRLDRDTTIADIRARGINWLRRSGIEYVLEPVKDIFVIYRHEDGERKEALFWTFLALLALTPGGGSPVFRGPQDNPIAAVQIRVGGSPELIGAIRDVNWHSPANSIWNDGERDEPGRDERPDGAELRGDLAGGGDGGDQSGHQ